MSWDPPVQLLPAHVVFDGAVLLIRPLKELSEKAAAPGIREFARLIRNSSSDREHTRQSCSLQACQLRAAPQSVDASAHAQRQATVLREIVLPSSAPRYCCCE